MFSRAFSLVTLLAIAAGASAIGACGERSGKVDESFNTEVEACLECKGILVECTSTSRDEGQFVECRDQWLTCQRGRGLGPDTCRNPGDDESCTLCRERLLMCKDKGDAATCEAEFSVCKAFLITRGDVARSCTETSAVAPQVACGICKKDYAACVSDGSGDNDDFVCDNKFGQCMSANGLVEGECEVPTGGEACILCQERYDACQASAGSACEADFDACAATIAPLVDCSIDSNSGQGGAGGTGAGGADGGATCSHSECSIGDALDSTCSTCAGLICAEDPWCCDMEWDSYCVDLALSTSECGCS